jgi:PST family polysaccharide transporter
LQPLSERDGGARRRLTENILSLYVLQGLNYVIPLIVLPYLVRVLGVERYGLVAFSQSFAQYFTILTDYGFNFSATRSIAKRSDETTSISRLFFSVLFIKLGLMVLGAIILLLIVGIVPRFHQNSAFFLVAYLAVVGNTLFPVWYFQGIEKMRYISGIVGTTRLVGAAALLIFVHGPGDALLTLTIQSLALMSGGIAGLWIAFKRFHVGFAWPTADDLRSTLAEGWHLFLSTAALSLYTNTNVFLVGIFAGNLEAGYFSAAEKLIRAVQGLINPIIQAIFPHMNSLALRSRSLALSFASKAFIWVSAFAMACSLFIFLLAGRIVELGFGNSAGRSIPILRWIALLPFLGAISSVLGVLIMITFGLDKQFSKILIFAGIFNVTLAIPFIRAYGANGAGAAVLFTEVIVVLAIIFVLRQQKIYIFNSENVSVGTRTLS